MLPPFSPRFLVGHVATLEEVVLDGIATELELARDATASPAELLSRMMAATGGAMLGDARALDGLDDSLKERLLGHGGNADAVRQELAQEHGIVASLRTVERAVRPDRQELVAQANKRSRFDCALHSARTKG